MPWNKSKGEQLDLLYSAEPEIARSAPTEPDPTFYNLGPPANVVAIPALEGGAGLGQALVLPIGSLYEDPENPRTEFPEDELDELAADIRQRGILQPIVVHPADGQGRYRIHFGAKRLRAAGRAGLDEVPVVVRELPAGPYAQVSENQKRHGLKPLELAKFIRQRVDAGDSNASIARQLGMNLTTVAHHLSLLDLPAPLSDALKSGRCASPRTLHELSKLYADAPQQVEGLLNGGAEITRAEVSAIRAVTNPGSTAKALSLRPQEKLIAEANTACDRLERVLRRMARADMSPVAMPGLIALRARIEGVASRHFKGSDGQTPGRADR